MLSTGESFSMRRPLDLVISRLAYTRGASDAHPPAGVGRPCGDAGPGSRRTCVSRPAELDVSACPSARTKPRRSEGITIRHARGCAAPDAPSPLPARLPGPGVLPARPPHHSQELSATRCRTSCSRWSRSRMRMSVFGVLDRNGLRGDGDAELVAGRAGSPLPAHGDDRGGVLLLTDVDACPYMIG